MATLSILLIDLSLRYTLLPGTVDGWLVLCCVCTSTETSFSKSMATPLIIGIGAITAAVAVRHAMRTGALNLGKKAGQELAKGGFKAKMDRAEAIQILGIK